MVTEKVKNLVFIRPARVASTSIERTLELERYSEAYRVKRHFTQEGWVNFGHMDYPELVKEGLVSEGFDKTAYKFSFVRNPYDRAVSLYWYIRLTEKLTCIPTFWDFCHLILDGGFRHIGLYNEIGCSICNPQVRWIENVDLDFLGRFESLQEDFGTLCYNIGFPQVKLKLARRIRRRHYSHYYDQKALQVVNKAYREDFERFNYPILD